MFLRLLTICAIMAAAATPASAGSQDSPRSLKQLIEGAPQNSLPEPQVPQKRDGALFDPETQDVLVIDGTGRRLDPNLAGVRQALRRLNEAAEALESSREALPQAK
ncbi:hypothetical protein [Jiella sp. M17.18]|uniref:hypothetical protein n=1 Tax=Jiella sp. M17.18 TaxID=3234247 RepID=UPI0034DE05A5